MRPGPVWGLAVISSLGAMLLPLRSVAALAALPPLPKSLSPSSISTWKQCPLLFKFRYVDRIQEPPTRELARGISAHEALAKLFDLEPSGRTPAALQDLFREAWRDMRGQPGYLELFHGSREEEREWGLQVRWANSPCSHRRRRRTLHLAKPMLMLAHPWPPAAGQSFAVLARYWDMEDPQVVSPVEREKRMLAKLPTGAAVVGVLDRLDRGEDGGWVIADYKTGAAPRVDKYSPATQRRIMDEKVRR